MFRSTLAAAVAASALALTLPLVLTAYGPNVDAHSNLVSSTPGAGSVVAASPTEIRITFSEPIEARATSADVLDAVGRAMVVTAGTPDPQDPYTLVVPVPTLPDGAYTVQWRSMSAADGHIVQGFFTFAVGLESSPLPGGSSNQGSGDIHAGHTAGVAALETIGRALGDMGAMVVFGLALVALIVVLPSAPALGPRFAAGAACAALIGAVGAALLADSAAQAASLGPLDYLTGTRSGELLAMRSALLAVGGVGALVMARRGPRSSLALSAAVGIVAIALLAASGHGAAFDTPSPIAAMVVHVASAGVWLAGLLTLGTLALLVQAGKLRASIPPLAGLVPRFSALALVTAALFGLTGIAFAGQLAGSLVALDSPYGWLLALKIVLVLVALALGGLNFLAPRDAARAQAVFRWRIPLEALVAVTVVVVTALLASGSPPQPEKPVPIAPAGINVASGLSLAIAPARPGPQRFVVDVASASGGPPASVVLELQRVDIDQGTSRIPMNVAAAGSSSWISDGGLLPADSSWTATVLALDAAGQTLARQRFDLAFDSQGLVAGAADRGLTLALLAGLCLLALAVISLTVGLAGGSLPRTPPRLGRAALIAGAAIAGPLGLLLVLAWPH